MFGTGIVATRSILRAVGTAPTLRASPIFLNQISQKRWATTETVSSKDEVTILNTQREKRPLSPHLSIYQPQLTWYPSMFNRLTGVALSGALYLSAFTYLLHPMFPALDSAHLIQIVHDTPTALKGTIKVLFALPFTFHTFNGIRHLAWDMGYGLTLKGMYAGAYTVIGLTAASTLYLAFFL